MVVECVDERHIRARRLAVPGLPAADQPLRPADRHRRPAALRPRRSGPRDLRPVAAARRRARPALALFAYVGGLSAATGMLIVETVAVSTMVCNDLVMPSLLRLGRLRRARGRRPDAAPAQHPPRRDRRGADARLPLLPRRRRGLCAGLDRPHQLRRGRAVRPGAPRRHVLARRHPRRRPRRPARRLRDLGLHADAAVGREVRLDRRRTSSTTARSASALLAPERLFGLAGLDSAHPLAVLEPARSTSRSTSASRSGRSPSAREASQALLFVDVFRRRRRRAGLLARPRPPRRPDARSPAACSAPPARSALFEEHAARDRRRGRPTSSPTPGSSTGSSASSPAPSAPPRRGSWSPRSPRRSRSRVDDVLEILDEASQLRGYARALEEKSRSLERRPPSSAPPTSSCRASTT